MSLLNDKIYNYEYFCQDNVCRLCWKITNNARSLQNDVVISDMILEYIDVNVTIPTPHCPKKVCNTCYGVIETFANFKKTCQEADRKLKIILTTGSSEKNLKSEHLNIKEVILKIESDYEPNSSAKYERKNKFDKIPKEELSDDGSDNFALFDDDDLFSKGDNPQETSVRNYSSIGKKIRNLVEDNCTYFECMNCKEKFKELSSKIRHELECDALNKFECVICFEILGSDTLFQNHMQSHRKIKNTAEANINSALTPPALQPILSSSSTNYLDTKQNYLRSSSTKTHSNVSPVNTIIKSNINTVQNKIKPNTSSFNTNLKTKKTLNTKLKTNINSVNSKIKTSINSVNTKIKTGINSVNTKMMTNSVVKTKRKRRRPGDPKVEDTTGVFKCNRCSEICETRSELNKHKYQAHFKQMYVCEVCGKTVSNTGITSHMLKHTNPKKYQCPHCSYHTTYPQSLKVHLRIHTGERRFACDKCPYRSYKSSNLYAHQRRHLGIKHLACHICGKSYSDKRTREDHIAATHDNIRRNVCKWCTSSYFRFRNLKQHILVKHGKRIKQVKDDYLVLDAES